jgi:acetolactate synthase-1/3 small subunit
MMRISRIFTRRQINLDSITVGIEPSGLARMILLFKADDRMTELLRKVLFRSIPIVEVEVIDPKRSVVREVALVKTKKLEEKEMWGFIQRVEGAGGRILESEHYVVIAEFSGEHDEIEKALKKLPSELLVEVARSGQVMVSRESNQK